jgi:hypothetical protein
MQKSSIGRESCSRGKKHPEHVLMTAFGFMLKDDDAAVSAFSQSFL